MADIKKLIPFGVSTILGIVGAVVVLIAVNASFFKSPDGPPALTTAPPKAAPAPAQFAALAEPDYKAIVQRNLFRAKLQVEIPKPKTEEEIEEETLTAIVKTMTLKGVMLSPRKRDNYAVIDLGGQKGVWVYEPGDVVERGLAVKEIAKDSVRMEKGDFSVVLKLFSSTPQLVRRHAPAAVAAKPAARKIDPAKEIRRTGSIVLISKSLAERLRADSAVITSSLAVKASPEGVKVVAVDKGSIAQMMGIAPNDIVQQVNGHSLGSTRDMNALYNSLKNVADFEITLLRGGKPQTLHYQIR